MKPKAVQSLDEAASAVSASDLRSGGAKTEFVQFRVSREEKESLQRTAKAFGMQVSEYLLRVHFLVSARLKGAEGGPK